MAGERLTRSLFSGFAGAYLEETGEGYVRVSLAVAPEHTNAHGVVHGGVVTTLMDMTAGVLIGVMRGEDVKDRPHATVEMSASRVLKNEVLPLRPPPPKKKLNLGDTPRPPAGGRSPPALPFFQRPASFLGSARPGDEIVSEARMVRLGKRFAAGETEAWRRSDGGLVALGRFTFVIRDRPGGPSGRE